ncbi:Small lysine-rich protein 1 [Manis javanica]|nr:Small lysine-rich protein 1 [Manis javanica]
MPGKGKKGKGRAKSHGKKQKKPEVDILSPAAMLNLYYIAHNVADCLHLRGFRWPGDHGACQSAHSYSNLLSNFFKAHSSYSLSRHKEEEALAQREKEDEKIYGNETRNPAITLLFPTCFRTSV